MVLGLGKSDANFVFDGGTLAALSGLQEPQVVIGNDWATLLEEYISAKTAFTAPNTVRYYELHSRQLAVWAVSQKLSLDSFAPRHMHAYIIHRRTEGVDDGTLRKACQVAKNMFEFARHEGHVSVNRFADFKLVKAQKKAQRRVPDENLVSFLIAIESFYSTTARPEMKNLKEKFRVFYWKRMRAIMYCMISTGCRPDELLEIRLKDLPDLSAVANFSKELNQRKIEKLLLDPKTEIGPQLHFRFTKTKRDRHVPICETTLWALREWLMVRPRIHGVAPDDHVFTADMTSQRTRKVDYSGLLDTLYKIQEHAGFERPYYSFYAFRRATASQMVAHNVLTARDFLGHTNISTTNTYALTTEQEVSASHRAVRPLERFMTSRSAERMAIKRLSEKLAKESAR